MYRENPNRFVMNRNGAPKLRNGYWDALMLPWSVDQVRVKPEKADYSFLYSLLGIIGFLIVAMVLLVVFL